MGVTVRWSSRDGESGIKEKVRRTSRGFDSSKIIPMVAPLTLVVEYRGFVVLKCSFSAWPAGTGLLRVYG